MKTWPIYLALQNEMAYPAGDFGGGRTGALDYIGHSRILPSAGGTLIVGPGGPDEVRAMRDRVPAPITTLCAHEPEVVRIEQECFTWGSAFRGAFLGDMHEMPFHEERFDYVFASQVLEHALAPYVALLECRRVLREGGEAHFILPSFEGPEGGRGPFHLHCLTEPVWRELLRKTGHEVVSLEIEQGLAPSAAGTGAFYMHFHCRAGALPAPHDRVLARVIEFRRTSP